MKPQLKRAAVWLFFFEEFIQRYILKSRVDARYSFFTIAAKAS
jgi:hypothetical protein